MRGRFDQVADRPHQGGGRCGGDHQGDPRAATPRAAADDQGESTARRAAGRRFAVLCQHRSPAVVEAERLSAPRRGQRLRFRGQQFSLRPRRIAADIRRTRLGWRCAGCRVVGALLERTGQDTSLLQRNGNGCQPISYQPSAEQPISRQPISRQPSAEHPFLITRHRQRSRLASGSRGRSCESQFVPCRTSAAAAARDRTGQDQPRQAGRGGVDDARQVRRPGFVVDARRGVLRSRSASRCARRALPRTGIAVRRHVARTGLSLPRDE